MAFFRRFFWRRIELTLKTFDLAYYINYWEMTTTAVFEPVETDKQQLSYVDLLEKHSNEEEKRQRERQIMHEGLQLWNSKKQEEIQEKEHSKQEVRVNSNSFLLLYYIQEDGETEKLSTTFLSLLAQFHTHQLGFKK